MIGLLTILGFSYGPDGSRRAEGGFAGIKEGDGG